MTADDGAVTISADQALQRLVDGNARFVAGAARFSTNPRERLADLVDGQQPYATILGCSDSRVPPELVFDAGLGELFIVRVAGNVVVPAVLGSLQYAGAYLATPLFVVLGHQECGAVAAALNAKRHGLQKKERVQLLLESIIPGLDGIDPGGPPDEQLARAVEANVRWSMRQVLETPEGRGRVAEGRVRLVGAVYELETGRARFLE